MPAALLFLLVLCGALGSARAALPPVSEDYVLRVWETDDGLPQNSVSGIAQTPDGYLWLATQNGLARFDGVRFTSFFKGTTPGLESSFVRTVATDRAGDLWLGLERGGVARMHGARFETLAAVGPPTSITSWASSFAEDAAGAMWVGQAPELFARRWSRGEWSTFAKQDGLAAGADTFLHADTDGRIWFATKMACGVFDGTRFQPIDPQGGERVHLAAARRGGMWATRGDRIVHYSADGTVEVVGDLSWLGGAIGVNVLFEDRAGDLWLGTRGNGLLRFRAGNFVRVPVSHEAVTAIFEDRAGSLWVGTLNGGLCRLRPQQFFLRDARHGLITEGVVSLCEDTEGKLWLAVRDSPPVRADDASNQSFSSPPGWTGSVATFLCADRQSGVWIGHDGKGLLRWRDGVYESMATNPRIGSVLQDRSGNIWIATLRDGLTRWRDGLERSEPAAGQLPLPRALAEDGAGAVWMGNDDGLVFRCEGERFVPVPLPEARSGESIRFIVPDGPETVWIGARDGGLLRWQSGRVERLPRNVGLHDSDLRSLLIDPAGNFWIATGGTLFRTTREDLAQVLAGQRGELPGVTYGRDDGLPKLGFAFGRRNASVRTRDGHLWFATDRGALEIDPQRLQEPPAAVPRRLLIEEMLVDGAVRRIAGDGPLSLPPQTGAVEFRFTVPRLNAPERLRFRYRLAGLDKTWTAAQGQRTATFTRLPPGSYRFEVAASEVDGPAQPGLTASLPFTVRAAWWETLAWRAAIVLLGALALGALVRLFVLRRMRARFRQLEQQHALEKERARIARDMHDEIGADLTRLALMSEVAAGEPEMRGAPARQLGEIAQAARGVSGTLDRIVWTVNPRNDTLERLVGYLGEFAAEYLAPTGLALRLELPAETPGQTIASEMRHSLLLATKEALGNAAKHADAQNVTLRVTLAPGALRIVIADDGRGFDPAATGAFGNGLGNQRQRLAALGGKAEIASRPGAGTTVTLTAPLGPP